MAHISKNPVKMIFGVAVKFSKAPEATASLSKSFIDEPGADPNVAYKKARAAAFELKSQLPDTARIYVDRVCTAQWNEENKEYFFLNSSQLAESIVFHACVGHFNWEKQEEI